MDRDDLRSKIYLKDIIENFDFKISKPLIGQELATSLRNNGLLEFPYLLRKQEGYIAFTCHNRIMALKEIGFDSIDAYLLSEPSFDIFNRNLVLKIFRSEVGPIGKVKVISILRKIFNFSDDKVLSYNKSVLKMPHELVLDFNFQERLLSLPSELIAYLDLKDVPFKTIRDLILLNDNILFHIDRWLSTIPVRLNIFKSIVEYLFDIQRGGSISEEIFYSQCFTDDRSLFSFIFSLRYPDYSRRRNRAEAIVKEISGDGLSIEVPEFFERDFITVKFLLKKSDSPEKLKNILEKIKTDDISEIFSCF
ncbi:MAG: hypothetical protein BWY23_01912 [Spirochaetes bacterium ADurb.Bin218]|jgi:hypothetical protein|nr:MAG: hypothetical protein BWY23_01912 [Spirochaetes bacterium ADurb.Bin218]HPX90449.1 hypothetical protein [Spirochaetota bacterium]